MRVCFALERDVAIRCARVAAVFEEQAKPPAKIKRPLDRKKAFDLLAKMNCFVLSKSCRKSAAAKYPRAKAKRVNLYRCDP